jgi:hypothetical protein
MGRPPKTPEEHAARNAYRRAHYAAHKDEINARRRAPEALERSRAAGRARYAAHRDDPGFKEENRARARAYVGAHKDDPEFILICSRLMAVGGGRGGRGNNTAHVDHDHVTGEVRGLLCHACNIGIGGLRDSIALLKNAVAYLESGPSCVLA